ncbi:gliding motility-associated C-terminal domain-containing protein, partial [Salmonella enterica subsp. enterica serovar Typhimurium]|nr:gliding motility-associated C-terminal domain-containing protein [Salmonella enterica subsp. enterica serovar Typhimurium]
NSIVIFNRWGDQVYSAAPYKNDWEGINKGAKSVLGYGQLPASTYYYVFDKGDGSKPLTGYVQLTR